MNDSVYHEPDDEAEVTLLDAELAFSGVSALVELLGACPPGYQVTGIFIHGLLTDVQMHLQAVLDNLRPFPYEPQSHAHTPVRPC